MIYVKYSSPDVSLNLAAEYYFASEKKLGDEIFMMWQPRPTIVVGNFQNIHEEVDVPYAVGRGIDIVRRLSGGGTVYQDSGSVQYAFIEKRDGEIDFKRYLAPIINALKELGIPAEADGRKNAYCECAARQFGYLERQQAKGDHGCVGHRSHACGIAAANCRPGKGGRGKNQTNGLYKTRCRWYTETTGTGGGRTGFHRTGQ